MSTFFAVLGLVLFVIGVVLLCLSEERMRRLRIKLGIIQDGKGHWEPPYMPVFKKHDHLPR